MNKFAFRLNWLLFLSIFFIGVILCMVVVPVNAFAAVPNALDKQNFQSNLENDTQRPETFIKQNGMCFIQQDGYYDFGIAYESNDPNPQFQWMSYNLDTQTWNIVADYNSSNWVSWKATKGNYWILCRLKTSDSNDFMDELCINFRYDFDNFSTCLDYQNSCYLLGCVSETKGVKYKFDIYNCDKQTWEWSTTQDSSWTNWYPSSGGDYFVRFEVLSSDGRVIGDRMSSSFHVSINEFNYTYTNDTQSSVRLSLTNPCLNGQKNWNVRFFVWSDKGERSDIKGISASNDGVSSYVDLEQGWFTFAGLFTVHVFIDDTFVGEYKVCLNESDTAMSCARVILDSIGWDLVSAYNWSKSFPYSTLPLDWSGNAYAQYGFQNATGNCYAKAATFLYMARQLGYNGHLISGGVKNNSGGYNPHGWVELYIGGETFVVDPDFEYETSKNGYMLRYGQSGTWVYNIGGILD